eukprot:12971998-Alexandrium_andersonii.AAC.1
MSAAAAGNRCSRCLARVGVRPGPCDLAFRGYAVLFLIAARAPENMCMQMLLRTQPRRRAGISCGTSPAARF